VALQDVGSSKAAAYDVDFCVIMEKPVENVHVEGYVLFNNKIRKIITFLFHFSDVASALFTI